MLDAGLPLKQQSQEIDPLEYHQIPSLKYIRLHQARTVCNKVSPSHLTVDEKSEQQSRLNLYL